MNDFELNTYHAEMHETWDTVVCNSKSGNFLHLRDYMDYHSYRFDEQSLIVSKNEKPVALFPCNRVEKHIVSHGGLTYGGLIFGTNLHAVEVLDIFRAIAEHYRAMGCISLMYKAIPHIYHRYPADEDLYALFSMGAKLIRRDISSVILMRSRLNLSDLRKRKLRKALNDGLEVIEENNFDDYHRLLVKVLSKFDAKPVHTLEDLKLLKSKFPNNIRLFIACKSESLLAGALVYDFGHVAHTQYLAASENGREIGALDYVISYLLDKVFADYEYFSFGISTEENGSYLNKGLIFQKEGFGGRGIVHDFYELDLLNQR